jgi:C4-dicarboxylate-specific signal transduction histidine kinase
MATTFSKEQLIKIVNKIDVFDHLPDEIIKDISTKLTISDCDAGTKLITKGEKGTVMYLVIEGSFKIHDGDSVIAEIGKGNYFGEFSLLDDEPRSMSVTALTNAVLASISQNDFYKLLNAHADTTRDIIKALIGRLRLQNKRMIDQMRERAEKLEAQVAARTSDLQKKNEELSETLAQLKKTQEQLVMQEKLATLGQLTAGIAHEIKNPLNFVNNFAALSNDLIEELEEAKDEEESEEVIGALRDNLARIYQHGKRADSIVASMMLHARESTGEKVPVNIHTMLEETMNLAYNGMPSVGQKIGINFTKKFDTNIPEINMVQQDLNRVFLNIFTNAIHAVRDKALNEISDDFKPTINITTKKDKQYITISIEDNGSGIPDVIKQKIFNPFFTTKPTGQGTGLGLSISFDILKAHGGNITVDSKENEYTRFDISLPLK